MQVQPSDALPKIMLARYYGASLGRFLSVDPIVKRRKNSRFPQRWNRFAYALNNPILFFDPDGLDVSVFIVGPGTGPKESYGHAAIWASNDSASRGVSYGGRHGFKDGKQAFIDAYVKDGRTVTEFKMKATPEQEQKALDYIKSNPDGEATGGLFGTMATSNCTTACGNVLEASGIVPEGSDPGGGLLTDSPSQLSEDLSEGGDHAGAVDEVVEHAPEEGEETTAPDPQSQVDRPHGGRTKY